MKYSKEKNLETILAIVLGLLVIYLFTGFRALLPAMLVLLLVPVFSHWLAGWITFVWNKIAEVMGFFMSRILLTVIFFGVLFPVSLLSRLFRKPGLQLKKSESNSYYVSRDHEYVPTDFEDPW